MSLHRNRRFLRKKSIAELGNRRSRTTWKHHNQTWPLFLHRAPEAKKERLRALLFSFNDSQHRCANKDWFDSNETETKNGSRCSGAVERQRRLTMKDFSTLPLCVSTIITGKKSGKVWLSLVLLLCYALSTWVGWDCFWFELSFVLPPSYAWNFKHRI